MYGRCSLLILICLISQSLYASFFELGQRSFIPANTHHDESISDLTQGPKGHIWVATQRGIHYYDGFNFIKPNALAERKDRFRYYFVNRVWFDSNENFYVGTRSRGVFKLNSKQGRWHQINTYISSEGSINHFEQSIQDFAEDDEGRVWMVTQKSLCLIKSEPQILQCWDSVSGNRLPQLSRVLYQSGSLLLATSSGVLKLNISFDPEPTINAGETWRPELDVTVIGQDSEENLWFATKKSGVFRVVNNKAEYISSLTNVVDIAFWEDQVWLASSVNGLHRYDLHTGNQVESHQATKDGYFLPTNLISSLHVDSKGVLWIGTFGNGIFLTNLANSSHKIMQYKQRDHDRTISKNNVRAVKQVKSGKLWLGIMDHGVDIFDPETLEKVSYNMQDISGGDDDISGIVAIAQTQDETIWLASRAGSLYKYQEHEAVFYRVNIGLDVGRISFLYCLSNGELLVLADEAALIWRKDTGFEKIKIERNRQEQPKFYMAVEQSSDKVWLNGDRYLYRLNPNTAIARREELELCSGGSLKDGMIIGPVIDVRGDFFAIKGGQLIQRKADAAKGSCYVIKSSLFNSQGNTLIGPQGHWWAYNHKVDRDSFEVLEFPKIENRPFDKSWITAKEIASDGTLIFGMPAGLMFIRPERIKNTLSETSVAISHVQIDEQRMNYYSGSVTVPASAKRLLISFVADDVANAEALLYRARLLGFNELWSEVEAKHRRVDFTNLPPGDYEFEVQALNRDGSWSSLTRTLKVQVEPSWYQTVWFKLFSALCLLLFFVVFYRFRTWQLRIRQKQLKELVAQRTSELQNSMDVLGKTQEDLHQSEKMAAIGRLVRGVAHEMNTPLGILKMSVSMLGEKLPQRTSPEEQGDSTAIRDLVSLLESNVSKLSGLVRNFKQISPDEYGSENESFLISEVVLECLSINQSRLQAVSCEVLGDENLRVYANRECLQVVLLELIGNALEHAWGEFDETQKQTCTLSIGWREVAEGYELILGDNGISIDQDLRVSIFDPFVAGAKSTGVGLGLHKVSLLVKQHLAGEISCTDSALGGCEFVLKVGKTAG